MVGQQHMCKLTLENSINNTLITKNFSYFMPNTEKNKQIAQGIFNEIQKIKNDLNASSHVSLSSWTYHFVQHPNNFPIVNHDRVFFWRCESLAVCKNLYLLIFQREQEGEDKYFDIKRTEGYLCVAS